ncbi:hypothetical protein [Dactylosporangium sp. CA-139066]|uniref:hypothetical protein n=1 Tax=Dactylosporangium sp. CA-139066 TaxID=3239930 RepID=UPI003D8C6467
MNGLHFAVVVGINRYPAISDLRAAVGDAERFVEWLADPGGGAVPVGNIELVPASGAAVNPLLLDAAEPAVHHINRALTKVNGLAARRLEVEPERWDATRLYLFVAGHGIAPRGGDGALLAANASSEELGHNIELSLYRRWYQLSGCFHELVVFADCCRSVAEGAPSNGPPFTFRGRTGRPVRVTVGYASELGGAALEGRDGDDPNLRRGYFTEALLRGLREARDEQFGGRVSSATLPGFVSSRVDQLATGHGRRQGVEFLGVPDMTFGPPAAAAHDSPVHHVVVHFPASVAGAVELLDHDFTVRETWDPAAGPLSADLPSGLYWVVRQGHRDRAGSVGAGTFAVAGADCEVRL